MHAIPLGQGIPADTAHAISVSLPSWAANVGYEEGSDWVLSRMKCGYPRFFVHPTIVALGKALLPQSSGCLLFPSARIAEDCVHFMQSQLSTPVETTKIVPIALRRSEGGEDDTSSDSTMDIWAVSFAAQQAAVAKLFWQHTGEGLSTRRAELCQSLLEHHKTKHWMTEPSVLHAGPDASRGPQRYGRKRAVLTEMDDAHISRLPEQSTGRASPDRELSTFIEERFGRNLSATTADQAKIAIRRRIADAICSSFVAEEGPCKLCKTPDDPTCAVDDVHLFPTGMSSIFNTHQMLLRTHHSQRSICFGFPYVDTLKILEKWGPGCSFYGEGSEADLDDLERRLQAGERYQSLFCEFPGNPLLKSPNLERIRSLADNYGFTVVVDETIGNFLNVRVYSAADVVVSSLTKVFSGDSNVMGGAMILNPKASRYNDFKSDLEAHYADNYWQEDAICMERNSRDYASRILRINDSAAQVARCLGQNSKVKSVYYPRTSSTKANYEAFRKPNGGYGGLLSVTFHTTAAAACFFDNLDITKGPSLGTNFSLCSPYTLLAHYNELDWAAQFGVDVNLVRISVGLEPAVELLAKVEQALSHVASPI